MKKKQVDSVPKQKVEFDDIVIKDANIQWLFSKIDGTRDLTMRRFTMNSVKTPMHQHPWEHIIYVLEGEGDILTEGTHPHLPICVNVVEGDVFFIPEGEMHGYSCDNLFVFLCVIPNVGDKRKWTELK